MVSFPERSSVCIYRVVTQGCLSSLEWRVQFCLLVCCTYPSLSTVDKEKNRTDQHASLRVDTRETQQIRLHGRSTGGCKFATAYYSGRRFVVRRDPKINNYVPGSAGVLLSLCWHGLVEQKLLFSLYPRVDREKPMFLYVFSDNRKWCPDQHSLFCLVLMLVGPESMVAVVCWLLNVPATC